MPAAVEPLQVEAGIKQDAGFQLSPGSSAMAGSSTFSVGWDFDQYAEDVGLKSDLHKMQSFTEHHISSGYPN